MKKLTSSALLVTLVLETSSSFAQGAPPKAVNPPAEPAPAAAASGSAATPPPSSGSAPESAAPRSEQYGNYAQESQPAPQGNTYAQTAPPPSRDGIGPVPGSNPTFSSKSLGQLEHDKDDVSLGMPITLLAIGGAVTLITGSIFLSGAFGKAACNSAYSTSSCNGTADSLMVVGGLGLAIGIPLVVIGGVTLGSRLGERRELGNEIERREKYYNLSSFRLEMAPVPTPGGGFSMGLTGAF